MGRILNRWMGTYRSDTVLHYNQVHIHAKGAEDAYRSDTVLHYTQVNIYAKGAEDAYRVEVGTTLHSSTHIRERR